MQPDPIIFLWGMRREIIRILRIESFEAAASAAVLRRIAVTLAHLAMREDELPKVLRDLMPRQEALLQRAARHLPVEHVENSRPATDVERYDRLAWLLSDHVRHSGSDSTRTSEHAELLQEARSASAIDVDLLERRSRMLAQASVLHDDLPPSVDERLHTATAEELTAYLRDRFPEYPDMEVHDVHQHRGVNTKDIIFFSVVGHPDWPDEVVLRRQRNFMINEKASMPGEYALLRQLSRCGIPVPEALLAESGAVALGGQPFIIMRCASGRVETVSSLGPHARDVVVDMARNLALIHQLDPEQFRSPGELSNQKDRFLARVDYCEHLWRTHQTEPAALLEYAFILIRNQVHTIDGGPDVFLHGDYDLRNLLIEDHRISAILDWERSRTGSAAEDLGYLRREVEQVMPWSEFMEIYRRCGGIAVSDEAIRFYQIWGYIFRATGPVIAHRGYCDGLHRDFLLGSTGYIEYEDNLMLLADLIGHAESGELDRESSQKSQVE